MTMIVVASNSLFMKRKSHLVTYQSSENQSQIDYIPVQQQNVKLVCDMKVIPKEECATQHKLYLLVMQEQQIMKIVYEFCTKKYGSSNKLTFMINFEKLLQVKFMTTQVSRQYLVKVERKFTLCNREDLCMDKKWHIEKTNLAAK